MCGSIFPRHIGLYAALGRSKTSTDTKNSLNQAYGITFANIWRTGCFFDAHYSKFNSDFGSGQYESLSLSKNLSDALHIQFMGGIQKFDSPLSSNSSAKFVNGAIDYSFGRRYFIEGNIGWYQGTTLNYTQWSTTFRLSIWRAKALSHSPSRPKILSRFARAAHRHLRVHRVASCANHFCVRRSAPGMTRRRLLPPEPIPPSLLALTTPCSVLANSSTNSLSRPPTSSATKTSRKPWSAKMASPCIAKNPFSNISCSPSTRGGSLKLVECRETRKEAFRDANKTLLITNGFASMLLVLHQNFESSYTFQPVGEEVIDGRTLVKIHFKPVAGSSSPAAIQLRGRNYPLPLAGDIWIERESGSVVKLISSLESSMDDLGLHGLRSEIHYAIVQFHDPEEAYWMPSSAVIDVETPKQHWRNVHRFTSYKRFRATIQVDFGEQTMSAEASVQSAILSP